MMPALIVLVAWLVFTGSHLSLSSSDVRTKFSPKGFVMLFGSVAALCMLPLIAVTAIYGSQGLPGLQLAAQSPLRWLLGSLALCGAIAITAGLLNYQRSPMATQAEAMRADGTDAPVKFAPPGAIDRITRHPFFVGLGVLALAHIPVAGTLAGAVFFACLATHCFLGIGMQDAKLRARWRSEYEAYEAQTSAVPFRAPQTAPEPAHQPMRPWLIATAVAVVVFGALHPLWSWGSGAGFLAAILLFGGGSVLAGVIQSRTSASASASASAPASASKS